MYALSSLALVAFLAAGANAQTADTVYYFSPDWSPDGAKIVFASGPNGDLSIYTVDVDGGNLTRLTDDRYSDEGPVWSPDGGRIAFFSNRREGRNELPVSLQIYVMNADGTGQRRVTHEGPALEYSVSWSPDGNRLAFQSRPEINPGVHSLYVIGVDGKGRQRVTDGRHNDVAPQWSPSGDRIVFTQSLADYQFFRDRTPEDRQAVRASTEIMVLHLDDGAVTPVTDNDVPDGDASWSRDGSAVYFFRPNAQNTTLYRQRLGETEAVAIAEGDFVSGRGFAFRPMVSPDGRFLTYNKLENGLYGIYIYDLELGRERRVVGACRDQ